MYHSLRRLPRNVHMVPRQQGSVMWATGIVIKRLGVWLHHMLPPPLLAIIHILLHCLNIILHRILHVHMLILWVSLRLRLVVSNSTVWPASPTPWSLNYTLRLRCLSSLSMRSTLSPNGCVHSLIITPSAINRIHTCNMHIRVQHRTTKGEKIQRCISDFII